MMKYIVEQKQTHTIGAAKRPKGFYLSIKPALNLIMCAFYCIGFALLCFANAAASPAMHMRRTDGELSAAISGKAAVEICAQDDCGISTAGINSTKSVAKTIYLTFDDGPSAFVTPKVADILKKHRVKATFFVVVSQALRHKRIIERLSREGHTVAVHCFEHDYRRIYKSPQSFSADLQKAVDGLSLLLPAKPDIMRFPGGSFNLSRAYIDTAEMLGLRYVDWNSTNGDTLKEIDTAQKALDYAVSTAGGRSNIVMLMHDNKSITAKSLDSIILHYKKAGYTFKSF